MPRTCERTKADREWVEADLSPYVRHYLSAAALCLLMRSHLTTFNYMAHKLGHWSPRIFLLRYVNLCRPALLDWDTLHQPLQKKRNELMHISSPSHLKRRHARIGHRHAHTDMFALHMKPASVFADCQAKRDSVAFHKPSRNRSKQKDCGVSREVPNWKQHRPQDRRLSYSVVLIR